MSKRIYLIDASGFIFRAYYALPKLTRSDGTPTGAVYGFVSMMLKLLEGAGGGVQGAENLSTLAPQHLSTSIAVIFDAGRISFRNEIYDQYKANRDETPPELIPQFPLVREAALAMGLATMELAGFEADDLIASYARAAQAEGYEVTVVSSDKDLMQLVDDAAGIALFDAMKDKPIREAEVIEKFGVPPGQVGEVLALMGDSSDNIPGVPGIGPKTAAELIQQYGDVETLLARAGEIKQNKRRESIIENAEKARLSRVLVTLKEDVPLPVPLADCAFAGLAQESLRAFLQRMQFRKLEERLNTKPSSRSDSEGSSLTGNEIPPTQSVVRNDEMLVSDEKTLLALLATIREQGRVAFAGVWENKTLVGVSLATDSATAYIPIHHLATHHDLFAEQAFAPNQLPWAIAEQYLKPLLADTGILKITADGKADLRKLHALGWELSPMEDVSLLSYVLDAGLHGHELGDLTELPSESGVLGAGRSKITIAQAEPEKYAPIAQARAVGILRQWHMLKPQLFSNHLLTVYERMERPLLPVLERMERAGIRVDVTALRGLSAEFNAILRGLEQEIYTLANSEFLIGSPKQLGEILFEKLGIAGGKKSKKSGQYATGAEVLEELAASGHVIAEKVLEWRQYDKLRSTYTEALEKQINPRTGRVHTTFEQTVAATGRLSSTNPNLQNIPIRTEAGKRIRHAFIAAEGCELIAADYSQIELRLLAEMADMPALKNAFREGQDIHAATASQMFSVPLGEVSSELRRRAKMINFGIIYGISAHGLAVRLGIERSVAADFINAYFEHYPGIKAYMEAKKLEARTHGYITTLFGRRVHIAGINDANFMRRAFAERQAINAPLQGTAADIIKRAMLLISAECSALRAAEDKTRNTQHATLLLQVHDELLFEVPAGTGATLAPQIKKIMESAAHLSLPLTVEVSVGKNWGEIH